MENKELIMKCALDLFYAKGYDAVGVQEIVDKAGVTKPTLYYYFGSKLEKSTGRPSMKGMCRARSTQWQTRLYGQPERSISRIC